MVMVMTMMKMTKLMMMMMMMAEWRCVQNSETAYEIVMTCKCFKNDFKN